MHCTRMTKVEHPCMSCTVGELIVIHKQLWCALQFKVPYDLAKRPGNGAVLQLLVDASIAHQMQLQNQQCS